MFWDRFLALEKRNLEAQEWQATKAVEAMEKDWQVLGIILALVVTFMLPAASPVPWQPPTSQQQSP